MANTSWLIMCRIATLVVVSLSLGHAINIPTQICVGPVPKVYSNAIQEYSDSANAIKTINKQPIAAIYSDIMDIEDKTKEVKALLASCLNDTLPVIVVYGMPRKRCAEKSIVTLGDNGNNDDYQQFIADLVTVVGNRNVAYIVEPYAIETLVMPDSCGALKGYLGNLVTAVQLLSANPNALVYADVGSTPLLDPTTTTSVLEALKQMSAAGTIRGVAINSWNFHSTAECITMCENLKARSPVKYQCVIDTSRNYNGPSKTSEWCNPNNAGIGTPPTYNTDNDLIDYFLWLKGPGLSDGECKNGSKDAVSGPKDEEFFEKSFDLSWDQGYFVQKQHGIKIGKYGPPSAVPGYVIAIICIIGCAILLGVALMYRRNIQRRERARKMNLSLQLDNEDKL